MEEKKMASLEMLVWYLTLTGLVVSACDYGEPVCPKDTKTIQWQCPVGQTRVVRAFWGREKNDLTTCTKPGKFTGKASKSRRVECCPGDEERTIAAVTAWCDANVNANGECVVKAPVQKLRYNGIKYDPCPGVLKYLKVCTTCESDCSDDPHGVVQDSFTYTRTAVRILKTSRDQLVISEALFNSVSIITTEGDLVAQLTQPAPGVTSFDIVRQGDILFFTESKITSSDIIHVYRDDGTYIASMHTTTFGLQYTRSIAIVGNKIFLGTLVQGLFAVTFDTSYNIINEVRIVEASATFYQPWSIHATETQLIVACRVSNNIHFLNHDGTAIVPPVTNELYHPHDMATDNCDQLYVMDLSYRVLVYSIDGTFIKAMDFTGEDQLPENIFSIYIEDKTMYLGSQTEAKVAIVELQ